MLDAIAVDGVTGSISGALAVLFALAIGHVIGDFPLQGDFLALGKSPDHWGEATGSERHTWMFCLISHCMIQAGAVWVITGNVVFALVELVLHLVIDFLKARGAFGLFVDQFLHIACKVGYVVVLYCGVGV